ncbi:MAG: response regulator [Spirochaetes bacterium]|nr:response regulator [Spirochaetota bacterium]
MTEIDREFLKRLIETFKIEAAEHISEISKGILALENGTDDKKKDAVVETVFRELHSLKGAARTVNLNDMGTICQAMEDIFSALKSGDATLSEREFDVLNETVDTLRTLLESMGTGETPASGKTYLSELIVKIHGISEPTGRIPSGTETEKKISEKKTEKSRHKMPARKKSGENKVSAPEKIADAESGTAEGVSSALSTSSGSAAAASKTVRVSTEKLERLMIQAEEMLLIKLRTKQHAFFTGDSLSLVEQWKKERHKIYSDVRKLEHFLQNKDRHPLQYREEKLLGFLEWSREQMNEIEARLKTLARAATEDYRSFSGMIDDLLDNSKKIIMLPFSILLDICPKVVRDLSHTSGKDAVIEITGEGIETDKRILDELKDPMIHLLRNAIDHGLERKEERIKTGKPAGGKISVTVSQLGGGKIKLCVSDDGRGIDRSRVAAAAVKKGIISQEAAGRLTEKESLQLVFQSGVSTSELITDLSGRGIGLPIVQEKVESLGGRVSISTQPGKGTIFEIMLPVTRTTSRVILIKSAARTFAVHTASVDRVVRVKEDQIRSVGKRAIIPVDGVNIPYRRIEEILGLQRSEQTEVSNGLTPVLIVASSNTKLALGIDEILLEQEALIKHLGPQLRRVRNIAGAIILGTGEIVPILNAGDLVKSAVLASAQGAVQRSISQMKKQRPKSVLVVEDSITTRTLMKNILEASGYRVTTTVDGIAAYTLVKSGEEFDIVVSDIDMPRMNGFDLTRKIRSTPNTEDLPVVLVTGLESREDWERGIDAGANAYIVKRSFDQSNLLEVIRRLI